jgi:ABC-type multidrug transport system fused ATPase/permease subunit
MNLHQTVLTAYRQLSLVERQKLMVITAFSFIGGVADIVSLMAIYPLISVLVQPDLIQNNIYIRQIWVFTGFTSAEYFIVMLACAVAIIVVTGSLVNIVAQIQANRFTASCQERLGRDLMDRLLHVPYSWYIGRNPLVLGSLFQQHIMVWSRDVIRRIPTIAGRLASVLLPMATLIVWSPFGGLFTIFAAFVLLSIFLNFVKRRTKLLSDQKKKAEQFLHVFLSETLQGIRDIKLSSKEDNFLKVFTRNYHITCRNFYAVTNLSLLPNQAVLLVGQLGMLCIGVGLFLFDMEGGAIASLMAIVVLVASRVFPAMNYLGTAINSLQNASSWIATLNEVTSSLKVALPVPVGRNPKESVDRWLWNEIVFQDVSFSYPNFPEPVLQGISLRLTRGGSYAFTGKSGSGKSTLVDLILGLIQPRVGFLEIDGRQLKGEDLRRWQANIGYVPQLPLISDATLRENVAFGTPVSMINDHKVLQCLALAHLSDMLEELDEGLYTRLGDRGARLSGGQRQRVAIARALYNDPDILVLDEASSALDAISEDSIRNALIAMHGNITIILIAHRFSTIRMCDSIFLLERGKVVAQGSYPVLLRENALFRQLAGAIEV